MYIVTFSKDKEELEYNLNKLEGMLRSKGIQTKRAYFREEQTYLACIPFMQNSVDVKEITKEMYLVIHLYVHIHLYHQPYLMKMGYL